MNKTSNNLDDDDIVSVSSEFLRENTAPPNSAVDETGNIPPISTPINDAEDEEFVTIFKPSKFVGSIQ